METVRLHLWVSGKVQGVFYRLSAQEAAIQFGVTGWVRNREDGRVEAVVEGDEAATREFVAWCRQGPSGARVDSVEITSEPVTGAYDLFSVAATY